MNATTIETISRFVTRFTKGLAFNLEGPGISEETAAGVQVLTNGTLGETMFTICLAQDGRTLIEVSVRATGKPFNQKGSSVEVSHPSGGGTPAQFRLRAKVFEQAFHLAAGIEESINQEGK